MIALTADGTPPPTTVAAFSRQHGLELLRFAYLRRCTADTHAGNTVAGVSVLVRRARTADVPAIKAIVDTYAGSGRKLLAKELVTLYEDVQEFRVAELDGQVAGCGALHVLWADLGEVRTLAVRPDCVGQRVGKALLESLIATARDLGLARLFALTFHTGFFGASGFVEIDGTPVDQDTYDALRRSYDAGVAEFLNLEYVKPNTLGNTRMLLELH